MEGDTAGDAGADRSHFSNMIEKKFGSQMLQNINETANKKYSKPFNEDAFNLNSQNYNSSDVPFDFYDVKKVTNFTNDSKRYEHQKFRYQSKDKATEQSQSYQFYLNRERISENLDVHNHEITTIQNDWQDPSIIPTLKNGLDVVVKYPGIYPTESINLMSKGKIGNYFTRLPQYSEIDENCIAPYTLPGKDNQLIRKAIEHNCKYTMSTSTISSVMSHIYFCMSNFKSPHFNNLSQAYDREPLKFMVSQRKPNTVYLTKLNKGKNLYSVDGDSGFIEPSNVVLLKMGKYMEKILTTDAQYFRDNYMLNPKKKQSTSVQNYEEDYFRYLKSGNIMLRSQIDTQGVDPEGNNIVFELKTRATSVLRYEISKYIDYLDYEIVKYRGRHSSYEREYYDLIRGGFLKYIMQCKIGQMHGALIAYHNTQKIFGFEYITLKDMERRIFGCSEFSDVAFKSSLALIEKIFDFVIDDQEASEGKNSSPLDGSSLTNKVLRIGFYANEYERLLNVMVEVFEDDQLYQERFKTVLPEYMKDPIDYYVNHKIQPQVYKYVVGIYPILNGFFVDHSPLLFEQGDSLDLKYTIQKYGKIDFNDYMKFLHEAYKCDSINIDNEYSGTWSFVV